MVCLLLQFDVAEAITHLESSDLSWSAITNKILGPWSKQDPFFRGYFELKADSKQAGSSFSSVAVTLPDNKPETKPEAKSDKPADTKPEGKKMVQFWDWAESVIRSDKAFDAPNFERCP